MPIIVPSYLQVVSPSSSIHYNCSSQTHQYLSLSHSAIFIMHSLSRVLVHFCIPLQCILRITRILFIEPQSIPAHDNANFVHKPARAGREVYRFQREVAQIANEARSAGEPKRCLQSSEFVEGSAEAQINGGNRKQSRGFVVV